MKRSTGYVLAIAVIVAAADAEWVRSSAPIDTTDQLYAARSTNIFKVNSIKNLLPARSPGGRVVTF